MSPRDVFGVSSADYPSARLADVVVQNLGSELLVYDTESDKAHHLNEPVALVWKACDGKRSLSEIRDEVSGKVGKDISEDYVALALSDLEKAGLLSTGFQSNINRRKVLLKYAPMAVALPVVMSLVAPRSTHAQSCVTGSCTPPSPPCCPGLFCSAAAEDNCIPNIT